jgi:hypothetical protein
MRAKKCKVCKTVFQPMRPLQSVCSPKCGYEYAKMQKQKDWRKEKKKRKEKLMTRSDWMKLLQATFNKYIRERDINKGCISCGASLQGVKFDAGHFYSVGSYPRLRFHEDNVHGQCVRCNQHLHGNIAEYAHKLPLRIGKDKFDTLVSDRNKEPLKLTVDEIKDLLEKYKKKIKTLAD